jgi:N-acylneuraminate cytidylyltransferase/CMP-N,N'-diacetyllegionaminic acid synthase
MKALAIIPARALSKRVPAKNIKALNGRPLILYTIEAAKNASSIERVVVSTDSEEIAQISKKAGAEVPFLRPSNLAQDTSPTLDAVRHAVTYLEKEEGYKAEFICILQPTSPFRTSSHIDEAMALLKEEGAEALVSVREVREHPYWMVHIVEGRIKGFLKNPFRYFQHQMLPMLYILNGAIYILRRKRLQNKYPFKDAVAYIMDQTSSIDIDTEEDFLFAESIAKRVF